MEIKTWEPTATIEQRLLPFKSVPSLVLSSLSLDTASFVDKEKPDPPVAIEPDNPHSFKRDANLGHKASFPRGYQSLQSLQKSDIPSTKSKVNK